MWAAKMVLTDGLGWRVGTGDHIRIFNDDRIFGSTNYRILNPNINCDLEYVAEIIGGEKKRMERGAYYQCIR